MSNKTIEKKEYSIEKKRRLAGKISDMRDKSNLKMIKKIIFNENPEMIVNKNSSGMLMFFENCSYNTYIKLEKFLKKVELEKLEKHTQSITETSDNVLLSPEDPNMDYAKARTRLRYSNKEKRLIKRQTYEKIISEKLDVEPTNTTDRYTDKSESSQHSKSDVNKHKTTDTNKKSTAHPKNTTTKRPSKKVNDSSTIFSKSTAANV